MNLIKDVTLYQYCIFHLTVRSRYHHINVNVLFYRVLFNNKLISWQVLCYLYPAYICLQNWIQVNMHFLIGSVNRFECIMCRSNLHTDNSLQIHGLWSQKALVCYNYIMLKHKYNVRKRPTSHCCLTTQSRSSF